MSDNNSTTQECPAGNACPWQSQIGKLYAEVADLKDQVSTDTLTGLFNYRHFTATLDQELERSQRSGQPTALIMLDLDHFKSVNDTYGHDAGNKVLKNTAAMLRACIRRLDIPCRYGGEEFAIILPATSLLTSINVAERVRQAIAENTVALEGGETLIVTASLGVAIYQQPFQESAESLIRRADELLYKAKQQGRNQVCYTSMKPDVKEPSVSQQEKDALFSLFGDSDNP